MKDLTPAASKIAERNITNEQMETVLEQFVGSKKTLTLKLGVAKKKDTYMLSRSTVALPNFTRVLTTFIKQTARDRAPRLGRFCLIYLCRLSVSATCATFGPGSGHFTTSPFGQGLLQAHRPCLFPARCLG